MSNLAINLRCLREQKKKTQAEVTKELNLGEHVLSNYENDKRDPDHDLLVTLADYYDVTVDELLRENLDTEEYRSRVRRLQNKHIKATLPDIIQNSELWKNYQKRTEEKTLLFAEHANDDDWMYKYFNEHQCDSIDDQLEVDELLKECDFDGALKKLENMLMEGYANVLGSLIHVLYLINEIESSEYVDELTAIENRLESTEKILIYAAITHNSLIKDLQSIGVL